MSKNNIRTIKCSGECLKENKKSIHPLTLQVIYHNDKDKQMCPTNNFLKNKESLMDECNFQKDQLDSSVLYQQMLTPNIIIDNKTILSIYKIANIQDLSEWVDNNLNNKPFNNINRILNIWIKININDLKLFNNALVIIIKKIMLNYDKNIKEKKIDSELKDYIDYWVKKMDDNLFEFNLIYDFKKYLNKKYGSK